MNVRLAATALAVCALSDLAAVPLLTGSDDAPAGLAVAVGVLGLLTLIAAFGVSRGTGWGRPLAIGTRGVDAVAAVPGVVAASGAETAAAAVTLVLSVLTIGLLTLGQHAMRTA